MRWGFVFAMIAALLLGGCYNLNVRESRLSTNQRVAMVSTSGNGFSPPTTVVLYEASPGRMVPVSTGYAQAPVTALMAGMGAAATLGAWNFGAAGQIRPDRTTVSAAGGENTNQTNVATATGVVQQNQAGENNVQVVSP